ncbi:hypothetical protein GGR57DRAFT_173324 [Xylariaceae sp. FL1272]|nr:hypothetical protein GGR57DRAFT_173324 [Xylariaceae sp. FL1272]
MSRVDGFPQFVRLPPELRYMIWDFACRSGPMLLTFEHHWQAKIDVPQWSFEARKAMQHQRQRLAILSVNKEARSKALKQYDLVPFASLPPLRPDHARFSLVAQNACPWAVLAIDWRDDIFNWATCRYRHEQSFFEQAKVLGRARHFALSQDLFYRHPLAKDELVRKILQLFPSLKRLIITYNASFNRRSAEIHFPVVTRDDLKAVRDTRIAFTGLQSGIKVQTLPGRIYG